MSPNSSGTFQCTIDTGDSCRNHVQTQQMENKSHFIQYKEYLDLSKANNIFLVSRWSLPFVLRFFLLGNLSLWAPPQLLSICSFKSPDYFFPPCSQLAICRWKGPAGPLSSVLQAYMQLCNRHRPTELWLYFTQLTKVHKIFSTVSYKLRAQSKSVMC